MKKRKKYRGKADKIFNDPEICSCCGLAKKYKGFKYLCYPCWKLHSGKCGDDLFSFNLPNQKINWFVHNINEEDADNLNITDKIDDKELLE